MPQMLFADFTDRISAEQALDQLELAGYHPNDLHFLTRQSPENELRLLSQSEEGGSFGEALAYSALLGGLIGFLIAAALLYSGTSGAFNFLIGNPLGVALGLSAAGTALLSGFITGLVVGITVAAIKNRISPTNDKLFFTDVLKRGGAVLAVPVAEGDEDTVRDILYDSQLGLLDGSSYEGSADYFSSPRTSAARTDSQGNAHVLGSRSGSRIRSSRTM